MISELQNYFKITDHLHTAGQPSQTQLAQLKAWGIEAVINLALPTSDNAVPGEAEIITGQGLSYIHIPVDFEAPGEEDFQLFRQVLNSLCEQKVLVHCAYNMRVSAFIYAYNIINGMPPCEAAEKLHQLWHPEGLWAEFIERLTNAA